MTVQNEKPHRVLVTGGTGILGSTVTKLLREAGYSVRVLSRGERRDDTPPDVEWAQATLATGEGVAAAVEGMNTILHAASAPFKESEAVDVQATGDLLRLAVQEGVGHFVYISIVGVDRIPFSYYQHKLEAERLIEAADVPWTIQRATQFHTFVDQILSGGLALPVGLLPAGFSFQPVDVGEVAQRLFEAIEAGPSGRMPDMGGPEILTIDQLAQARLQAEGRRKPVLHFPFPGKVGQGYRAGYHTTPDHAEGTITYAEWVNRRYGQNQREPVHEKF